MSKVGRYTKVLTARLTVLVWAYITLLIGWPIFRTTLGDWWFWLFVINSFAPYYFLPLIPLLLAGLIIRRRSTWTGLLAGISLWVLFYGALFFPQLSFRKAPDLTLSVMTYNVMGFNWNTENVIEGIRYANADIVLLQELNSQMATAFHNELTDAYPYQLLDPQGGPDGMGIISRYPMETTGETLPGTWVGRPQIVTVDFLGTPVTVLNVHTFASVQRGTFIWTIDGREEQAQIIADFVERHPEPIVVGTDFNATDQHTAYDIVTTHLKDSWREAGWGFGHTFPGAVPYPEMMGIPFPAWTVRIDYVFHSEHWQAVSAETGPWDEVSDHRPVIATLRLKNNGHSK